MSNIIINGAAENGDGAVELTVATDGSITATPGTDKNNVAPSTDDLASKLADGSTTTASGGKLHAAAGGGPSGIHARATYTSGDVFVIRTPVPACKVRTLRCHWSNVPSGAVVAAWIDKNDGSPIALINTSGASGKTHQTDVSPVSFAANDTLTVTLEEDGSGNPASGSVIDVFVDLESP